MDFQHFLLPKPLRFIELTDKDSKPVCIGCWDLIYGPAYISEESEIFVMHKSCTEMPPQIRRDAFHPHPFSFEIGNLIICDRCENLFFCFISYRCMNCPFSLDFKCAKAIHYDAEFELAKYDDVVSVKSEINHFCHRHQLTRCKVSYRFPTILPDVALQKYYMCRACSLYLRPEEFGVGHETTLIYTCLLCELLLHESCVDNMPMEFQSLFHPQHLLLPRPMLKGMVLTCYACRKEISYISFFCSECDVNFHVSCAKYQTRAVQLQSHPHHLLHLGKSIKRKRSCDACGKYFCNDSSFSCIGCDFHVHPECVPLQSEIQHPSHSHSLLLKNSFMEDNSGEYYCDACETERNPELHVYYCEKCNYAAHINCIIFEVKPIKDMLLGPDQQRKEVTYKGDQVMMSNEKTLHKAAFHHHPMILSQDPNAIFVCDGCGELCSGSYYNCNSCSFNLDIKCAVLNEEMSKDKAKEGREIKITTFHLSHNHQLSRCKTLGEYFCMACKQVCYGLTYTCLVCMFFLHESCLLDMNARSIWSQFHPHLLRSYAINLDRSTCYLCGKDIKFIHFLCMQCKVGMHYACAKYQTRMLTHECHDHPLLQFGKSILPRHESCSLCDSDDLGSNIFSCLECGFRVHLECLPLPYTVKHKRHLHMLTLTNFVVEDDSKEYYCDTCEMETNPELEGYCCRDCKFFVHIDCIVSKVEPPEKIFEYLQPRLKKGKAKIEEL